MAHQLDQVPVGKFPECPDHHQPLGAITHDILESHRLSSQDATHGYALRAGIIFKMKATRALAPRPSGKPGVADRPITPKRTRASKPKVRTGCRTCKIRRVKCDEAKPVCQQCQRGRIVCDGYDVEATPNPKSTDATKGMASSSRRGARPLLVSCPGPGSAPSSGRFSPQEVPYIDFFRHALTIDFTGYSCTDFWSRIVLCEAMTSDCVRHAVLAIAALSAGIADSLTSPSQAKNKPSALFPWTARLVVNGKHGVALRHYVQALALFRKQVGAAVGSGSARAALIMTLLLITFELLQGNMESVDSLMTSSIKLLGGSLAQYQNTRMPNDTSPSRRTEDVRDIEHMLPFLSIMGAWTPFLKAQRTNLALWDTSPGDGVLDIPPQNTNQLQIEWSRFFARATAFTGQAFAAATQHYSSFVPSALVHQQQAYLSHLSQWDALLRAALARATSTQTQHAIRIMRLHRLSLAVCMRCCLDATDMAWDRYDAEFQTLVDETLALFLSAQAAARPSYHARFTLSMGILSTLGPAIAKCRNHGIRMRALEMARRMPWREGAWDAEAELYGKLGAVLLEERGRRQEDGVVPAEERWTWVEGTWDRARVTMVGKYAKSVRDEKGEEVIRTLEMGLDGWVDVCGDVGCTLDHAEGLEVLG
jgi:hypothetical protein